MKDTIAVRSLTLKDIFRINNKGVEWTFNELKQNSLIFDQIAVWGLDTTRQLLTNPERRWLLDELDWLIDKQIIIDTDQIDYSSEDYKFLKHSLKNNKVKTIKKEDISELDDKINNVETATKKLKENLALLSNKNINESDYEKFKLSLDFSDKKRKELELKTNDVDDYNTRIQSILIKKKQNKNVVPILLGLNYQDQSIETLFNTKKVNVITVVLNSLPIPNEVTPWQHIIEFKTDPDSISKFLALRNWISETSKGELNQQDIKEKLEYLLDQYEQHLRIHKMKYHKGVLETVVTTVAEVAEDLIKFKWGKIAQGLFSIRNKKIALLEEEVKAPGKEIAYISKTNEQFILKENNK